VQPLFAELAGGGFAVAHNGNLTNAMTMQRRLQKEGSIFSSTSDTETILHLIATSPERDINASFIDAVRQLEGAFSLVALTAKKMIGCRDPLGIRPLVLGDLDGAWILASETVRARHHRRTLRPRPEARRDGGRHRERHREPLPVRASEVALLHLRVCLFRPSRFHVEGRNVYDVRKAIGMELARENPVEADLVVPVPDSGTPAAIGFAQAAALPFELGIIRNHYVGRTFIQPGDSIRHMGVKLKHNANRRMIEGKRVVLVDDSIVRGTTSQKIVQMVRDAGARRCTCASHRRRRAPRASTASIRQRSPSCSPRACRSRRWRSSSASIRWASCRSTGSTAPSARQTANNEAAAILRRLLHGPVPDGADRPRRFGQRPHAFSACACGAVGRCRRRRRVRG
jgi:amidophosphoribosyltransferase